MKATLVIACACAIALIPAVARADIPASTNAFWDRVAQCETGGNWHMRGSSYSGGVGFYNQTWTWWAGELGLARRYPNAADAPRAIQVRVADYGYRVHHGYWGCIR